MANKFLRSVLLPRPARRLCRIQYLSDLHLEVGQQYDTFTVEPKAPYVVFAGDIGRLIDYEKLVSFFARQCQQFQLVLFVLGNHEFYGTSRAKGLVLAAALESEPTLQGKFRLLHRTRVDIPDTDVTILGCTLQSHILDETKDIIAMRVQDFHHIEDWTVDDHNQEHILDLEYLKTTAKAICLEQPDRRLLVVTHHAPVVTGTSSPKDTGSNLSSAFATDVIKVPSDKGSSRQFQNVKAWIFGHTHFTTDFNHAGVRVVANQRGYVFVGRKAEAATTHRGVLEHLWKRSSSGTMTKHDFDPLRCVVI